MYSLLLFVLPEIDPCHERPCANGGICKKNETDYFCVCPSTHSDKNCQTGKFRSKV